MKKGVKTKILCLALCAAACVFGGVACGSKDDEIPQPPKQEVPEKNAISVSYNETSGIVSWQAAEGATKYVVVLNMRHTIGEVATYETTATSQQLALKKGLTLITVYAYKNASEIGVGTTIVESELDFVHPGKPENLVYDKQSGTLSWGETESAAKYVVSVTGLTREFSFEEESTTTSKALNLVGGVYEISVTAINAQGSKGMTTTVEYATYTASEFDQDENVDGVYELFNFNDVGVLDLTYSGEYMEWSTATSSASTAKIVDRNTLADVTDETTDGALRIGLPDGETQENATMNGITIRLPKEISVGVLSFDLNRQTGATTGIMLSDGKGHTAYYGGLGDKVSWKKWETMSIDIEKFLENNDSLECVREIGIYLRSVKEGAHYVDNLCYERLGNVSDLSYDTGSKTLSWNKVYGATEYVVKQGATELYRGSETSVVLADALDKDYALTSEVTVEATDGTTSKEKDFVLSFFGEMGDISMDQDTLLVYWDEVEGVTGYTLYLNGEQVYQGSNTSYQVSEASGEATKDWTAKLVAARGTNTKEKTAFVLCKHGTNQTFGELKPGTTDEHYVAEWHNLAAWGQFSKDGYAGGAANGVKFVYSGNVYDDYDTQTRIKAGYLTVNAGKGWGEGAFGFVLPTALKVAEIGTLKFTIQFTDSTRKLRLYFNDTSNANYLDVSNSLNATVTTDSEGWSTYTVSALKVPVTEISTIYLSTNAGYTMHVKEITYTEKGEDPTQSYGKLKVGTTSEYYIAEWSDTSVWGRIAYDWTANKNTYTGGVEGGVTLDVSKTRSETQYVDGELLVWANPYWGHSPIGFMLPESGLTLSEITSLKFTLKFSEDSDGDKKPRFYFNGANTNALDGSNSENVTVTTNENGYSTYTIDVAKLTAMGLTNLQSIYISSNGSNLYKLTIQEITYTKAAN